MIKSSFKGIWSLAKKTVIDTRDDFRNFISGQGSAADGPLKPSSSFDSDEFAPRGKEDKKADTSVPNNSGGNSTSSSGKKKLAGSGAKSTNAKSARKADSKSTKLPTNPGGADPGWIAVYAQLKRPQWKYKLLLSANVVSNSCLSPPHSPHPDLYSSLVRMSPAVGSREASTSIDDPTFVVPAQEIQLENVTRPSDDPPVEEPVGDADGAQRSLLKPGNLDIKLEDSAGPDPDESFRPPPLPSVIPKGPISPPVIGHVKPVNKPNKPNKPVSN
ncbi:hypothetical protein DFS33DRAFT_1383841 [Desarmillaria ectypa]|nr:hypothetical protein DFS33DRAFT_1383841 [Desarmillaria ectypa]